MNLPDNPSRLLKRGSILSNVVVRIPRWMAARNLDTISQESCWFGNLLFIVHHKFQVLLSIKKKKQEKRRMEGKRREKRGGERSEDKRIH